MPPVPLTDQHRIVAREDVLSRQLDSEAVLLDLASGTYFGLDAIGSEIWALIAKGTTVASICEAIVSQYDVDAETARADLERLVTDLSERGLVEITPP
jgi:hypothetical protein